MFIRPVKSVDVPTLQKVARSAWERTYCGIYTPEYIDEFLEKAYSHDSLEQAVYRDENEDNRKFLVAELEGAGVIGFLQLRQLDEHTHELLRMYLLPEHQGEGGGTRLLMEAVRRNAIRKLQAWVEGRNTAARTFYERKGFTVLRYETETFSGYTSQLVVYEKQYDLASG